MNFLSILNTVCSHCIWAYIYIAGYLDFKIVLAVVSSVAAKAATLIKHWWNQDGQNVEAREESSDNIQAIEQTEQDIRDTLSLHHQRRSESRESATRELMLQGTITSVVIRVSEPVMTVEIEVEVPEFKTAFKVACSMITISAGGIVSLLAGFPGNETAALTHKIFFKAYTLLVYASVISSLGLLFLIKIRPNIPGLAIIVKFIMWVALGSATYALGFAMCILLLHSLVANILVLVAPLLLAAVAATLNFINCRKN